jgi:hypothetical protein
MSNSNHPKNAGDRVPTHAGVRPAPAAAQPGSAPATSGRVVHDARGNAVWDWLKQTSRIAIDSTSRLLRRLETPELKVEKVEEEQLRLMPDPSSGGGYDPYNQATKPPKRK